MVSVKYRARLGNQMFQYCFGRILAEGLGYALDARPLDGFPGTADVVDGARFDRPRVVYAANDQPDLAAVVADPKPRHVVVNAYLQRYAYYRPYAQDIRRWLRIGPAVDPPAPDDLVVHVRLGDYLHHGWALDPLYYLRILEAESFDRLFLVTDEPGSPLLSAFERFHPVRVERPPLESLRFLAAAGKLILSQSTFGWWGAFLSGASRIYFPVPPARPRSLWSPSSAVDLRVDEPRYVYVTDAPLYRR